MKNEAILKRIKKLTEFIRGSIAETARYDTSAPGFACDEAELWINFKTGTCSIHTWMISGHNGDPYGVKRHDFTPDEAKPHLEAVEANLWFSAEAKVAADARKAREVEERKAVRRTTAKAVGIRMRYPNGEPVFEDE